MKNINIITRLSKDREQNLGKALEKENFQVEYYNLNGFTYDNGNIFHNGLSINIEEPFLWKIPDSIFPSVEKLYEALDKNHTMLNSYKNVKQVNHKYERHVYLKNINIPNLYTVPVFPGTVIPSSWTAVPDYGGNSEEYVKGDGSTVVDLNTTKQWVMFPSSNVENVEAIRVNIFNNEILWAEQVKLGESLLDESTVSNSTVQQLKRIEDIALQAAESLQLRICSMLLDPQYGTILDIKTDIQNNPDMIKLFAKKIA